MIREGHKYHVKGRDCVALQTGHIVKFLALNDRPNAGDVPVFLWAHANEAKPMPMKYHGGEVPQ
jgi:hypothetical protein